MAAKSKGPRLGMLYLVLPFTCGLLWLEHQAPMPAPLHELTLLFIVFLVFGLLGLWSQSNANTLEEQQHKAPYPMPTDNQAVRRDTVDEPAKDGPPPTVPFQRQPRDYGLNPVMVVIADNDMRSDGSFSDRSGQNGN